MNNNERDVLAAIPFTEPAAFGEFCGAFDDCPEKGNKEGWRELFSDLRALESLGLISVEYSDRKIDTLTLTEEGKERLLYLRRRQ
jgi:hypothetical protein